MKVLTTSSLCYFFASIIQLSATLDIQSIREIEDELDSIDQKQPGNFNHQYQEKRDKLTPENEMENEIKDGFDEHNKNSNNIDKVIVERIIKKYLKQKEQQKSRKHNPKQENYKQIISDYLQDKEERSIENHGQLDHAALDEIIADYLRTINKKRKVSLTEDTKVTRAIGNEKQTSDDSVAAKKSLHDKKKINHDKSIRSDRISNNNNNSNDNNNNNNGDRYDNNNEEKKKRIVDSGPSNLCQYYQVQKMRVVHYQGQTFQYPYVETIKDCYRFK